MLTQEGLPQWVVDHRLRWFYVNILPILPSQINGGTFNWAVEWKGELEDLENGGKVKGWWRKVKEEEVGGRWKRHTWLGEAVISKGSHS